MLLKLVGPFWLAPLFAAFLSVAVIICFIGSKSHSYESGFPAFFCALPMAFYMAAVAQVAS